MNTNNHLPLWEYKLSFDQSTYDENVSAVCWDTHINKSDNVNDRFVGTYADASDAKWRWFMSHRRTPVLGERSRTCLGGKWASKWLGKRECWPTVCLCFCMFLYVFVCAYKLPMHMRLIIWYTHNYGYVHNMIYNCILIYIYITLYQSILTKRN